MNNFDLSKFSSGKFWLTIAAALVFVYCSVTKILPVDKVYDIISIIVVAYFMKGQNNTPKGA